MWLTLALAAPTLKTVEVEDGSKRRTALVYRPKGGRKNAPVVIAYHGIGGNPSGIVKRWAPVAKRHDLVLVIPVIERPRAWFGGGDPVVANLDRGSYETWRDWAVENGGSAEKVHLAGYSMGAHYAASIYCSGEPLAGLSLMAMAMEQSTWTSCKPVGPVPTAYIAARGDPMARKRRLTQGGFTVQLVGQRQTENRLAKTNGCTVRSKQKQGRAKLFVGTCDEPLVRARLKGSSHAYVRPDFDPALFSWEQWTAD